MSAAQQNPERVSFWDTFNSLTGYEEDAIESAFHADLTELTKKTFNGGFSMVGLRAMVFVLGTRSGLDADKALDEAQKLSRTALSDRFLSDQEDADDAMPEEPDTDLGKPDSPVE